MTDPTPQINDDPLPNSYHATYDEVADSDGTSISFTGQMNETVAGRSPRPHSVTTPMPSVDPITIRDGQHEASAASSSGAHSPPRLCGGPTLVPRVVHPHGSGAAQKVMPSPKVRLHFERHAALIDQLCATAEIVLRAAHEGFAVQRDGTDDDKRLFRDRFGLRDKAAWCKYTTVGSHAERFLTFPIDKDGVATPLSRLLPLNYDHIYPLCQCTDEQIRRLAQRGVLRHDASRATIRRAVAELKGRAASAVDADEAPVPQPGLQPSTRHETYFIQITAPASLPQHRRADIERLVRHALPTDYGVVGLTRRHQSSEWAAQIRRDVDRLSQEHTGDSHWLNAISELMPHTGDELFPTVMARLGMALRDMVVATLNRHGGEVVSPSDVAHLRVDDSLYAALTPQAVARVARADVDEARMSVLRYARDVAKVPDEKLADEILFFLEWARNSFGEASR